MQMVMMSGHKAVWGRVKVMAVVRQCGKCGARDMIPGAREMQPFNSRYIYHCRHCDNEVQLVPMGSIGHHSGIAALLSAIVVLLVLVYEDFPSLSTYLILSGVLLAFQTITILDLRAYWKNPVVDDADLPEQPQLDDLGSLLRPLNQSQIEKIESGGFWKGFFSPILFFATILALAAAAGFINDSYLYWW